MYACMYLCGGMCKWVQAPQRTKDLDPQGAGVTMGCEPPNVSAGNRNQFLCKSSITLLSTLSSFQSHKAFWDERSMKSFCKEVETHFFLQNKHLKKYIQSHILEGIYFILYHNVYYPCLLKEDIFSHVWGTIHFLLWMQGIYHDKDYILVPSYKSSKHSSPWSCL